MEEAILDKFPEINNKQRKEIEKGIMPHYVFYYTISKSKKSCYCTHCNKEYIEDKNSRIYTLGIMHNAKGKCIKCGKEVVYKSAGYGTKNIEDIDRRNVLVITSRKDEVFISGFIVNPYYFKNKSAIYKYEERVRYYFNSQGISSYWKKELLYIKGRWKECWNKKKNVIEPKFRYSSWNNVDNSYQVIGLDSLKKSYLKYYEKFYNSICYFTNRFIYVLGMYNKHPNIEYIANAGFMNLLREIISGDNKLRINWKSNDLKKMLKLNKEEIKAYKNCSSNDINAANKVKKADNSLKVDEIKAIIEKYGCFGTEVLIDVSKMTGLSIRQCDNYTKKCKGYSRIFDWIDYLRECQELGYNVKDTVISKPKDLGKSHDKTSKLLQIKRDEIKDNKIFELQKKLFPLCYENENLVLIPPKSSKEIIDEGKILSHCVGGYIDRHINGTCVILFLRRKEAQDKPYYTVELRDKTIIQYRGYKNNINEPVAEEVENFIKEYKKYLKGNLRKVG